MLHWPRSDPTPRDRPPSSLHSTPRTSDTATETCHPQLSDGAALAGRVRAGDGDQNWTGPLDTHDSPVTKWHAGQTTVQVLPHAQLLCINIKKRALGEFYVFRLIFMSFFDLINQLMNALGGDSNVEWNAIELNWINLCVVLIDFIPEPSHRWVHSHSWVAITFG